MQLQAFEWIFLENGTWHCTVAKQISILLDFKINHQPKTNKNHKTYIC